MRTVRFLGGLLIAFLVHLVGVRLLPAFPLLVDLFLVVLVFQALDGDSLAGLLAGLTVGLVEDTLGGRLYGLFGVADTVVGYATARFAQRVVIQRTAGVMLAFLSASLVQQGLLLALAFALFPDPETPHLPWIFVRAGTAALLGASLFFASRQWRRSYEGWRRSRHARVHFG